MREVRLQRLAVRVVPSSWISFLRLYDLNWHSNSRFQSIWSYVLSPGLPLSHSFNQRGTEELEYFQLWLQLGLAILWTTRMRIALLKLHLRLRYFFWSATIRCLLACLMFQAKYRNPARNCGNLWCYFLSFLKSLSITRAFQGLQGQIQCRRLLKFWTTLSLW